VFWGPIKSLQVLKLHSELKGRKGTNTKSGKRAGVRVGQSAGGQKEKQRGENILDTRVGKISAWDSPYSEGQKSYHGQRKRKTEIKKRMTKILSRTPHYTVREDKKTKQLPRREQNSEPPEREENSELSYRGGGHKGKRKQILSIKNKTTQLPY